MTASTEEHYSVALIGSSGGGTATLGHTNPTELLRTVHRQLLHVRSEDKLCLGLTHAIFVSLCDGSGFDSLKKDEWLPGSNGGGPMAKLYSVGFHHDNNENQQVVGQNLQVNTMKGPISEINREAKRLDAKLAKILCKNYAVIALSSEPTIIHADSLRASAKLSIPVTCSGGTSSSQIAALYDLPVIGAQGSVASTTLTKARGWARGLAHEWGMTYDPRNNIEGIRDDDVATEEEEGGRGAGEEQTPPPTLKSILEAALPSFLFVCIVLRFFGSASERSNNPLIMALRWYVPSVTCCILAATSRHSTSTDQSSFQDQSTILMSSALAGILASASASQHFETHEGGSALAGLIAGALIPAALSLVSDLCIKYHITATMTNILCGGGVGMLVGGLMHFSSAACLLSTCTGWIRCLIRWRRITIPETDSPVRIVADALVYLQNNWINFALTPSISKFVYYIQEVESSELLPIPKFLGFACGCIVVYGSKIGWYHSIFLPLIMLEMDSATGENAASLFGAIDECSLVMICGGICLGNLMTGCGNSSLSWQALKTNILCGDFIEACYPFMERSRVINASAYLAAGLSTEIIAYKRILSSAYFPLPLSILISNDRVGMAAASLVAFTISLVGTIVSNKLDAMRKRKGD